MSIYEEIQAAGIQSIPKDEIEAHFSLLPDRYFLHHNAREIELHIRLIHQLLTNIQEAESLGSLTPVVDWQDDQDRSMTVVHIVTWDRAGLFYKLAGAFALAGLNIISSKAISRSDHITIDTFYVVGADGGAAGDDKIRATFNRAINKALLENKTLLPEIEQQAQKLEKLRSISFRSTEQLPAPVTPRVEVYHELSLRRTIVEIKANDRLGLLYELAYTIYKHGFDITFGRISTERGVAIDTFYIESILSNQESETQNLLKLREAITDLNAIRDQNKAVGM